MPLFGSKKKNDFSGSPTAADDDSYYTPSRGNTLHKQGPGPVTNTGAGAPVAQQAPAEVNSNPNWDAAAAHQRDNTISRKKNRGGLFGRRRGSSDTDSDDARFGTPQGGSAMGNNYAQDGVHGRGLGDNTYGNKYDNNTTGAGGRVAAGGNTYGGNGQSNFTSDDMGMARDKVHAAEAAEREALRMLSVARTAVKEAHEHVDRLALQADEEARRAGLKQKEAQSLRKDTQHLGRSF